MSIQKRKYELRARAERQRDTRRRIAAAAAELHEEVGPARTTVAEIARRAGVQRLTVYKNFPDEYELFAACQRHFLAENPPPDPTEALAIADAGERLDAVLRPLYRWYRRTERMSANVRRDRAIVPALDALWRARRTPGQPSSPGRSPPASSRAEGDAATCTLSSRLHSISGRGDASRATA